jgi:hypothetical protein
MNQGINKGRGIAGITPILDPADVRRQEACGEQAFRALVKKQGGSSVLLTTFAPAARTLTTHFTLFLPEHCKVQTLFDI